MNGLKVLGMGLVCMVGMVPVLDRNRSSRIIISLRSSYGISKKTMWRFPEMGVSAGTSGTIYLNGDCPWNHPVIGVSPMEIPSFTMAIVLPGTCSTGPRLGSSAWAYRVVGRRALATLHLRSRYVPHVFCTWQIDAIFLGSNMEITWKTPWKSHKKINQHDSTWISCINSYIVNVSAGFNRYARCWYICIPFLSAHVYCSDSFCGSWRPLKNDFRMEQGKMPTFMITSSNVGKTIINHPFGDDKHSTYLLWFGGVFIIVLCIHMKLTFVVLLWSSHDYVTLILFKHVQTVKTC